MKTDFWNTTLSRRLGRRRFLALTAAAGATGVLAACSGESATNSDAGSAAQADGASSSNSIATRPSTWVEASHGNHAPQFNVVFPSDKVQQLKLVISAENWQAMLADMVTLFGARGSTAGGGGGGPVPGQIPGQPPDQAPLPGGGNLQPGGGGGAPGGGGGFTAASRKPMWVAGDIEFNGETWTHVGIRFKGNSSLRNAWQSGSDRIPFKVDFDEWEDDYPEINNQRFYGFKQLSLSTNLGDTTHMRETLVYDILEDAGLPATNTAFYELLLDRGEGVSSLGFYTVIEVIDDTMVNRVFGSETGNIYEAEGSAASLASGVAAQLETSFQKENNETEADWSDIKALHTVLHSPQRTADEAAWKKELEAIFDVPVFLEWLAIAALLQHWDTYGGMTHNFYLYNDPKTKKLTWISWDHNFVLGASMGGGGGAGGANQNANRGGLGGRMNTSLDKTEVGANWPLIRYLMDVPDYYAAYRKYMQEAIDGPLNAAKVQSRIEQYAAVMAPAVQRAGSSAAFDTAVAALVQTVKDRNAAAVTFLAS